MLKNQNMQARLFTAFMFIGVLVVIVAVIGWIGNARLSGHIDKIANHVFPSVVGLWKVNEAQAREYGAEKSLIISSLSMEQRQKELAEMQIAIKDGQEGLKIYDAAYRFPEEEKIYERFKTEWSNWQTSREQLLRLHEQFMQLGVINPRKVQIDLLTQGKRDTPEFASAQASADALTKMNEYAATTSQTAFDKVTNVLLELIDFNTKVAQNSAKSAAQDVGTSTFFILVGLILGPSIAAVFAWYFSNTIAKPLGAKIAGVVGVAEKVSAGDLTTQVPTTEDRDEVGRLMVAFRTMTQNLNTLIRQVQQSGIQITTSATQIAASGKQLEATMTEQIASTNEVAATAREISANSKHLVKTIGEVQQTSQVTAQAAGESQKDLMQMETTMRKLAGSTSSISSKLGVISDKANSINSIVTTITKVADQTNLLSLNAAIEAEKAGEYGTGFAVVAREIRRLADQTAVATLDIENMVKEMQGAVSTGVMEMDKFTKEVEQGVQSVSHIGTKLESIIEQVQTLTPRFQEVGNSMEGQSQGAVQISEAMVQLSEASSQTAQSLREVNGAINQLNEAAQGLRQEVSRFKVASN
ncbi:HAMP domain-containing methyl-accepting chemotaxis protein [Argonema antarcticum]|uniref:HAMP domain-containing methyl-accepting chemotaxis protein n=1 Tax=Argonema antarcticum TaxID=2942763 RepID=UPI002012F4E9|nr:methyl-accepting chemotaxis protein [Argonema antarcticum]MCL1469177.1 methyl-accepting chemotaxis protein [Argonema antarcticum A004/B2]